MGSTHGSTHPWVEPMGRPMGSTRGGEILRLQPQNFTDFCGRMPAFWGGLGGAKPPKKIAGGLGGAAPQVQGGLGWRSHPN